MTRLLALIVVCGTLLAGDVHVTVPTAVPPDWANLACFTRIKINGHPACKLLVWKI